MLACPHCSETLPFVTDAYCPFCRESLNEPEKVIASNPDSAADSKIELKPNENPYATATVSPEHARRAGVILYTELPRRCPNCEKKFGEVSFRRRFKRKMRWTTISYMLLVSIGAYVLLALLLPAILVWAIYLVIIIPVLGNAMTWPKIVGMSCFSCNWKKSYVVAGTGTKRK